MLANIFSNRYFIIGALAFFVFCVVGSLLYMQHVETQTADDLARTDERIKALTPPSAEAPVGETSQGGLVHADGNPQHEGPHEPPQGAAGPIAAPSEEDWSGITPEQRAQVEKMRAEQLAEYVAKWGEPPSPDASYQHYRDNHGNVHRHYIGTVAIQDYEYTTMFAPTPEELERYKQLRVDLKAATSEQEAQRLRNEIQAFVESAQREIPYPTGFVYIGESNSGFLSPAEEKRHDAVAIRAFYQRFGIEHLYELHHESTQFYQKY